jgi:hypothetical protein
VWTCTCVFVVTAVFTSLHFFAVWPSIAKKYEGTLFNALIAQVLAIGVAAFARGLGIPLRRNEPQDRTEQSHPSGEEETRTRPPVPSQVNEQTGKRPPKKRRALIASALAAAVSLVSGLAALMHIIASSPVVVAASDLVIGDDCQLASQARIIGSAKVTSTWSMTERMWARAAFDICIK